MEEEEGGWAIGSLVAMLVVAAVLFLAPLGIGHLHPLPGFILLVFPVLLVAIFIFLSHASKQPFFLSFLGSNESPVLF
ncbi:hypothetical protein SLE2022_323140 [Rubroshorea leprosula]